MGVNEQDTLESIIRAAKDMVSHKNVQKNSPLSGQTKAEEAQTFRESEQGRESNTAREFPNASPEAAANYLETAPGQPEDTFDCSAATLSSQEVVSEHAQNMLHQPEAASRRQEEAPSHPEIAFDLLETASDHPETTSVRGETAPELLETISNRLETTFSRPEAASKHQEAAISPSDSSKGDMAANQIDSPKDMALGIDHADHGNVGVGSVGIHFLEFAVAFLTLAKCQYQRDTDVKVNSLPFFTLVALDNWAEEDYTMSELAEKLQITKQQFSRLINDLEEKGLVERIHDKENRRRVYIRICDLGREMMEDLKQDMLNCTLQGLRSYSVAELAEMDFCICRLTKLMEKFDTDPK